LHARFRVVRLFPPRKCRERFPTERTDRARLPRAEGREKSAAFPPPATRTSGQTKNDLSLLRRRMGLVPLEKNL